MIVGLPLAALLVFLLVVWFRRRRHAKHNAELGPLAGYDTGVRSPWRYPGSKFLGPKRGF